MGERRTARSARRSNGMIGTPGSPRSVKRQIRTLRGDMRIHLRSLAALVVSIALIVSAAVFAHDPTVAVSPSAAPAAAAPGTRAVSRDWSIRQTPIVDLVKRVRPAVVNIHSERTAKAAVSEELWSTATTQNRINGMGTGIIIDPRGYIITNYHVVEVDSLLRVRLTDGSTAAARVVARDVESDLAMLKIDVKGPLPTMPLGTSSDLMVGETVVAIGNAYGYEHTVTAGIVSALGRDVTLNKDMAYKQLIQTDASINPGNSGGPLLNIHGDLIGVNVAIRAGAQGIGFAIPVDAMIRVAGDMLANKVRGGPAHGLVLKNEVVSNRDDTGLQRQAVVERVEAGSPAAKAGVQRGDVLVRLGEQPIATSLDFERGLLERPADEKIALLVRRNGTEQKLEIILLDAVWRKLGLRVQTAPPEEVMRTHPQLHGGLAIVDVRPDSAASKAGLQRGDILIGLHTYETVSLDNVLYVLNHPDLATFSPLKFYILRTGKVTQGSLASLD
jgi:serine protease Do